MLQLSPSPLPHARVLHSCVYSEVEGATIDGVERRSIYRARESGSEEREAKKRKEAAWTEQDDRVLSLLFRKGGEMRGKASSQLLVCSLLTNKCILLWL